MPQNPESALLEEASTIKIWSKEQVGASPRTLRILHDFYPGGLPCNTW